MSLSNENLSYAEKLELMERYLRETGKQIEPDTIFEGYKIGIMRKNMRAAFCSGTLKMDKNLLEKYIELGIITEKKCVRTSIQEKYEFLILAIGKTPEQIKTLKMRSGMTYKAARKYVQRAYNRGRLKLTPKQIKKLINNGILNPSKEQIKQMEAKYNLPAKYVIDINRKYGSFENFLRKYKTRDVDYEFGKDVFVGYRGVVISREDITQAQKLKYARLILDTQGICCDLHMGIDIDEFEMVLQKHLSARQIYCLKMRYGLLDNKEHTYDEIGKSIGANRKSVFNTIKTVLKKLRNPDNYSSTNYKRDLEHEQSVENEYMELQRIINNLNIIIQYITNSNGCVKEKVEDIELCKLGIKGEVHIIGRPCRTIHELINEQYEHKTIDNQIAIEELNLSLRAYNTLKRNGIDTLEELEALSDNDLLSFRHLGQNTFTEVKEVLGKSEYVELLRRTKTRTKIQILLDKTNYKLRIQLERFEKVKREMEEFQRKNAEIIKRRERFEQAQINYIEQEDIFNPNAIVLGVPDEQIVQEQTRALNEMEDEKCEFSKNKTYDDVAEPYEEEPATKVQGTDFNLEEDERRVAIIARIEEYQKQIDKLKEELTILENNGRDEFEV